MSTDRSVQRWLSAALWVVGLALLASCGPPPTEDWQTRLADCPDAQELGKIEAWDRLEVRVHGQDGLSGQYDVSPAGMINFPRLGQVEVAGLRCDEVEQVITQQLAEAILRNPSVVCLNLNQQARTAVTIDGEVSSPGIIDYRRNLMLTDVIAQSGGLTVRANGDAVVVTRKLTTGKTDAVVVPYNDIISARAPNVCMAPGDFIFVDHTVF